MCSVPSWGNNLLVTALCSKQQVDTPGDSLSDMPINDSHVGKVYPPTEPYVISAAKIAEFSAAIQDDNPAYAGTEAIAPPTFAAVLSASAWNALFVDPELDVQLHRTVHSDQRFVWNRPLQVGDEVTAALTITRFRARGATEMITIAVELSTVDGALVCTATSTLIHTREIAA